MQTPTEYGAPLPENFTAPTAEQVTDLLRTYPPRGMPAILRFLPLIALGMAIGFGIFVKGIVGAMLAILMLMLLMGAMWLRFHRLRTVADHLTDAQELAILRRPAESTRLIWRLLPSLVVSPDLHLRAMALLGHNLEQVKAHESALAAYEHMLDLLPQDHPATAHIQAQRAIASLADDRLVDADDALRRLRGMVGRVTDRVIAAAIQFARLLQDVRTHHHTDAVSLSPTLVDDLQPLGVEAGFGHALMALSFHELSRDTAGSETDENTEDMALSAAKLWWSRATLLLPVHALVDRYAELKQLANDPQFTDATRSSEPPQS